MEQCLTLRAGTRATRRQDQLYSSWVLPLSYKANIVFCSLLIIIYYDIKTIISQLLLLTFQPADQTEFIRYRRPGPAAPASCEAILQVRQQLSTKADRMAWTKFCFELCCI